MEHGLFLFKALWNAQDLLVNQLVCHQGHRMARMNEKPIGCRWPEPASQTFLGQAPQPDSEQQARLGQAAQAGEQPARQAHPRDCTRIRGPPGKRKRKLNVF